MCVGCSESTPSKNDVNQEHIFIKGISYIPIRHVWLNSLEVLLRTCIWEFLSSSPIWYTSYPGWGFHSFPQSLNADATVPLRATVGSFQFPYNPSLICHSTIQCHIVSIQSVLLNNLQREECVELYLHSPAYLDGVVPYLLLLTYVRVPYNAWMD
jgi:hypothetical protein